MSAPLPFHGVTALLFWGVFGWVFAPEFALIHRSTAGQAPPAADRGSLNAILLGFSLAMLAAFLVPSATGRGALPGPPHLWYGLGLAVLVAGALLRRHCFRLLGHRFTGAVQVQDGHQVVDTGAYRWVRHPSYSAAFLILLGVALAMGNGLSALVALALAFPAYRYRALVEEAALLQALGEPYARFLATRKRFLPGVY